MKSIIAIYCCSAEKTTFDLVSDEEAISNQVSEEILPEDNPLDTSHFELDFNNSRQQAILKHFWGVVELSQLVAPFLDYLAKLM